MKKPAMRDIFKDYRIFNLDPSKLRSKTFFKNMLEYRGKVMQQFKSAIKTPRNYQCPLCKSRKGKEFLSDKSYKLYECSRCKLVSPNVDFSKLGNEEVYDDPSYIRDTTREILDTYQYRKKTYAPERLAYILQKTGLKKSQLKVLDVGCGPGYFLSYLKDLKITYKGLELADFLVAICKKRGLNVEKAFLEEEKRSAWNVITLFDVLEHLTDPIDFFKQLNHTTSLGGFVLAYTPNIHSVAFHLMGAKQNTFAPYQHLCFFDPASLEFLAQKTGFKIHSIEYYGLDIMDYLYMKEYEDNRPYLKHLIDMIPPIQAIIDRQQLSNHIRVIFKKTKAVK